VIYQSISVHNDDDDDDDNNNNNNNHHNEVCVTIGPQSLPDGVLHTVHSSAFLFNFHHSIIPLQ